MQRSRLVISTVGSSSNSESTLPNCDGSYSAEVGGASGAGLPQRAPHSKVLADGSVLSFHAHIHRANLVSIREGWSDVTALRT
jgi:hypothetical protein